uniref:hypothetical protein n=1 Tax=Pararhizobium sp. IMCC3301 TaxID=3067904 RepID=UPI00274056ED|nr:hypothetical protein [Pararhizobium sp. IMCC3301]
MRYNVNRKVLIQQVIDSKEKIRFNQWLSAPLPKPYTAQPYLPAWMTRPIIVKPNHYNHRDSVSAAITKGLIIMAKKSPWHSTKQQVHHNNTECNTGNNIEKENLRQGAGGKPLCKECARLS